MGGKLWLPNTSTSGPLQAELESFALTGCARFALGKGSWASRGIDDLSNYRA